MATTKLKGERFVREVSGFASTLRNQLDIDRADVDLRIFVTVEDQVTYDEHEDED